MAMVMTMMMTTTTTPTPTPPTAATTTTTTTTATTNTTNTTNTTSSSSSYSSSTLSATAPNPNDSAASNLIKDDSAVVRDDGGSFADLNGQAGRRGWPHRAPVGADTSATDDSLGSTNPPGTPNSNSSSSRRSGFLGVLRKTIWSGGSKNEGGGPRRTASPSSPPRPAPQRSIAHNGPLPALPVDALPSSSLSAGTNSHPDRLPPPSVEQPDTVLDPWATPDEQLPEQEDRAGRLHPDDLLIATTDDEFLHQLELAQALSSEEYSAATAARAAEGELLLPTASATTDPANEVVNESLVEKLHHSVLLDVLEMDGGQNDPLRIDQLVAERLQYMEALYESREFADMVRELRSQRVSSDASRPEAAASGPVATTRHRQIDPRRGTTTTTTTTTSSSSSSSSSSSARSSVLTTTHTTTTHRTITSSSSPSPRHRLAPTTSSGARETPPPPASLPKRIERSFLLRITHHRSHEDKACVICTDAFFDGESLVAVSKCLHRFHPHCINGWISMNASCPTCRDPVEVESQ